MRIVYYRMKNGLLDLYKPYGEQKENDDVC